MKSYKYLNVFAILVLALGLFVPSSSAQASSTVLVYNLAPSWTAPGGGGVYSAYVGPTAYGYVSPGATALYDGREAGIIKAGLMATSPWDDEGLFGFQPTVTINDFAAGPVTYDVETQAGVNPVWMTIEIDTGVVGNRADNTTYQFVPTINPAGWHTVDAGAGLWQKWNNGEGDTSGNPKISLSAVAAAHTGLNVVRAYLRLGMGNSYYNGGTGTIAWVDKATLGGVTYDFVAPIFCGTDTWTLNINFDGVTNLYGYQFKLHYDETKVSAAPVFVNSFFDTATNANVPPTWNATDSGSGVISFAASKMAPGVAVSGSGTVASITFTGIAAGTVNLTFSDVILSDIDGNVIPQTLTGATINICGVASASGVVSLQGRSTPMDAGTITITDGVLGTYTTNFDPVTGAWSIPNIKAAAGGTSYTFTASHGLYLGSSKIHILNPGDTYAAGSTKLRGGDADNSGLIDISDLTCIGGAFGGAPVVCGATGSSDINMDTTTNILDLVLAGGNYGLATPQVWP